MSNSRKKSYKKRKQAAHTKVKVPNNVPAPVSKSKEFFDNWLWLITLVAIIVVVALMIILIPKCDASCASCQDSCAKKAEVSASDVVSDSAVTSAADIITTTTASTDTTTVATTTTTTVAALDPNAIGDTAAIQRESFPDVAQFQLPADGEEIAVLETSKGTIKLRLFPDAAPKAVENFKGLIKQGYYNGITFHRVISDFMIQSGSPDGTGTDGESIWGTAFEDELLTGLHNYRGALSMANSGSNTNGSQFFIVQATKGSYSTDTMVDMGLSEDVAAIYDVIGGTCWLDGETKPVTGYGHTVFGQVIEGMNVVDAIATVAVNSASKPNEDVLINKAYLENYTA